tara:strand:- start:782 stop:913 length:132 start_codon:yes stop_codon:yes gene_type:complete
MLFSFNQFWKYAVSTAVFSVVYVIWGFEFTIITLLALILAKNN